MKKLVFLICVAFSLTFCEMEAQRTLNVVQVSYEDTEESCKEPQLPYKDAVDRILVNYPKATLQDIYKSFFQDKFGPEHIISDTISVRKYLDYELQNMKDTSMPYYEATGKGENFVRVSLQTVKDSIVSKDELLNLFIKSADSKEPVSITEWINEWETIKSYVPKDLEGFEEDNERIDNILSQGEYAIHHSDKYNELYSPHYRIIKKELFELQILPKLKDL